MHLNPLLLETVFLLNTELLEVISFLHGIHELPETHTKRQSAILSESLKEVFAEVPTIPGVDGRALLSLNCAEVEFVSIAAFQEERARDSTKLWGIGRALDQDLSLSCLDVS